MFNAVERLSYLSQLAGKDKNLRFKDLYKLIKKVEFIKYAYDIIKRNQGSNTAGVDGITKVHFADPDKLNKLIESINKELENQTYQPQPVRRVEIPKGFGKTGTRPLGIPVIKDRIVQSACKLILEAIYEQDFVDASHGFRPKRSCQTAVTDIIIRKYDWVIEGDIKGCFDNIKHGKLLDILRKRIADEKFINLINKFLKSGYQMGFDKDGKLPVYETKSGTPQGGIVSPVLANIYLHEFDKEMSKRIVVKDRKDSKRGEEYTLWTNKIHRLGKQIETNKFPYKVLLEYTEEERKKNAVKVNNDEEVKEVLIAMDAAREKVHSKKQRSLYNQHQVRAKAIREFLNDPNRTYPHELWISLEDPRGKKVTVESKEEAIKLLRTMKKIRNTVPWEDDKDFYAIKTFGFTRYADDFVILLGGYTKNEAEELKEEVKQWFDTNLSLTLSDEKTKITHATKGFTFLGYDIIKIPNAKGRYEPYSRIYVPEKAKQKLEAKIQETLKRMHNSEPASVFYTINRITAGWGNYYKIANNWSAVKRKESYFLHWQIAHWLGRKHKTSIPDIFSRYKKQISKNGYSYKTYVAKLEKDELPLWNFDCIGYETAFDVSNVIKKDIITKAWHVSSEDPLTEQGIQINLSGSTLELKAEKVEVTKGKCQNCGKKTSDLIAHHTRMVKRNRRNNKQAIANAYKDLPKVFICEECHEKAHPKNSIVRQL